jgi:hypothetical protein
VVVEPTEGVYDAYGGVTDGMLAEWNAPAEEAVYSLATTTKSAVEMR